MMKKYIAITLMILTSLCAGSATAQEEPGTSQNVPAQEAATYQIIVKHGNTESITNFLESINNNEAFNKETLIVIPGKQSDTVLLRGTEENLKLMQAVIKVLDVEPMPVEIPEEEKLKKRTIELKYGLNPKVEAFIELLQVHVQLEGEPPPVSVYSYSEELGWLMALGTEMELDEFEVKIHELDVPPQAPKATTNLEIVFYLLSATESSNGESYIPKSLSSVVTQLQNTFQYGNYSVIDTSVLRSRVGNRLQHSTSLPLKKLNQNGMVFEAAQYQVEMDINESPGDKYVLGVNFQVDLTVVQNSDQGSGKSTNQYRRFGTTMESNIDVYNGQTIILGKSNFENSNDALFVVMQVREVE